MGCLVKHAASSGWLSVAAAADRLGCSELTVRRRIKDGDLPACRPGHAYRVWGPDLDNFVRSRPAHPQRKIQRKPFSAQVVNEAERRERAEAGLRALRANWRSEVARVGLQPEALCAAFADEYEHHPGEPGTALGFALKGMRNPVWLSEHRAQVKLARRLGGAGNVGDPHKALASLLAAGIEVPAEAMRLLERELDPPVPCSNGHDVPACRRYCPECGVRMVA